jgi:hypothetical protein
MTLLPLSFFVISGRQKGFESVVRSRRQTSGEGCFQHLDVEGARSGKTSYGANTFVVCSCLHFELF